MKAKTELLEAMHGAMAQALISRIKDGSATAADLAVARQFLKDNGIDAIPRKASPLTQLRDALPFPSPDGVEEEEQRH